MAKPFPILGFDVGGTKVAVSLVLSDGTLVSSTRVPNKEREPDDVLPAMVSAGNLEGAGMCGKGWKEWVKVSDGGPCIKARIRLG